MPCPLGYIFVDGLQRHALQFAEKSALMRRLQAGERFTSRKPDFDRPEPGRSTQVDTLPMVQDWIHPTTLQHLLASYLVERFLLEENTQLFLCRKNLEPIAISRSLLDGPVDRFENGVEIPTDDLGCFVDLLQTFVQNCKSRYPFWNTEDWTLQGTDEIERHSGDPRSNDVLSIRKLCFPHLLLREDQVPDTRQLNKYLDHSTEEFFTMQKELTGSKSSGRPPTARRECKRILSQRYPNGRPKENVEALLGEVNDALRSDPNIRTGVSRRTFYRVMQEIGW